MSADKEMTPEELAEIDARVAAATPGPWMAWSDEGDHYSICRSNGYFDDDTPELPHLCIGSMSYGNVGEIDGAANAKFAAHARTDIPRLRQHIDRQAAYLSDLREVHEALKRTTAEQLALKDAEIERLKESWRCFHCGFETANSKEAAAHFGDRDDAEEFKPLCRWWQNMTPEERGEALQDSIQQLNDEQEDSVRLRAQLSEAQRKLGEVREALGKITAPLVGWMESKHSADWRTRLPLWRDKTNSVELMVFDLAVIALATLADTEVPKP